MSIPYEGGNMDEEGAFDPFEKLPDCMAITIIVGDGPPKVDLGSLSPHFAIAVLDKVLAALHECILPPVITYDDHVIYAPYFEEYEEYEEEEGYDTDDGS